MRRLYEVPPSAEDLQASGIPAAAAKSFLISDPIELWHCNVNTFTLFAGMRTQWLVGMGGKTGLNYAVLGFVAAMLKIKLTPQRFREIQLMELEALRVMSGAAEG